MDGLTLARMLNVGDHHEAVAGVRGELRVLRRVHYNTGGCVTGHMVGSAVTDCRLTVSRRNGDNFGPLNGLALGHVVLDWSEVDRCTFGVEQVFEDRGEVVVLADLSDHECRQVVADHEVVNRRDASQLGLAAVEDLGNQTRLDHLVALVVEHLVQLQHREHGLSISFGLGDLVTVTENDDLVEVLGFGSRNELLDVAVQLGRGGL